MNESAEVNLGSWGRVTNPREDRKGVLLLRDAQEGGRGRAQEGSGCSVDTTEGHLQKGF